MDGISGCPPIIFYEDARIKAELKKEKLIIKKNVCIKITYS